MPSSARPWKGEHPLTVGRFGQQLVDEVGGDVGHAPATEMSRCMVGRAVLYRIKTSLCTLDSDPAVYRRK